jgi:hypothetical protein
MKIILSFLIYLLIVLPAIALSIFVVPILLHTKWDGRTTIFGNRKWGRSTDHPSPDSRTHGYWSELLWFVWRNPVNNLCTGFLAVSQDLYLIYGDRDIGDKTHGGAYWAIMGYAWEYYRVIPYTFFGRRCIRIRFGWKINGNDSNNMASYVFTINPIKLYSGL